MVTYYRQIRSDVDTARLTSIHPRGALALVCAAVSTLPMCHSIRLIDPHHQVARALRMHKTGVFITDPTPFSEKDWGADTKVYLGLINELSDKRWDAIYSAIKVSAEVAHQFREFSMADTDRPLQDESEDYHIRDSDPEDPEEGTADIEYE